MLQNSCLGTFIDIEGAFDKTNFSSIQQALQRHRTNPLVTEWIMNMLRQRIIRLSENQTHQALVMRGCPQGGVLSPLLWNLVVNELITKLNNEHFMTIGYADDLVILISGLVINTLCDLTQTALKIVEKWCKENDLSVNPKKDRHNSLHTQTKTGYIRTANPFWHKIDTFKGCKIPRHNPG